MDASIPVAKAFGHILMETIATEYEFLYISFSFCLETIFPIAKKKKARPPQKSSLTVICERKNSSSLIHKKDRRNKMGQTRVPI